MSTRLAIYTDVEKIRSWFNHFHISPSICTLYVINIGPFIYICKNPSSVPTSKHGLFKSKFPLYSPLSWLITAVWEFNILHTINNQGNVCELVKLSLFIQFVQHDFVVRREHASTLHLPLHLAPSLWLSPSVAWCFLSQLNDNNTGYDGQPYFCLVFF